MLHASERSSMGGDETPVRAVDEKKLIEWAGWMEKTPATLASYARRLSGMLSLSRERFPDLYSWKAPAIKAYAPGQSGTRERIVSREEAQLLVSALLNTRRKSRASEVDMREAVDVFRIALVTGMRAKEVFRMSFSSLREKSSQIFVGFTKTGYDRTIPLPPAVTQLVDARKKDGLTDSTNIFPRFFAEPSYYHNIRRALLAATKAAGIEYGRSGDGFTLHDARATYITNILRGDRQRGIPAVSIGTAMKLSGHRTLAAFQKYVRMVEEDVASAVMMSQSLAELHMN